MTYSHTKKLIFPLENYKVTRASFGKDCVYGKVHWGIHLGEDALALAGTEVRAIGKGSVVYSALHPGTKEKPNWGNIIIIAHKNSATKKNFFSLYAHLGKRLVEKGDSVKLGQTIGKIGKSNTPENEFWKDEHLHFAIYVGKWNGKVLPGYWKEGNKRTKLSDWKEPTGFIKEYAKQ